MDKVNEIRNSLEQVFENVDTIEKLNNIKVEYLGKKGIITELNSMIKELKPEEKKEFGMKVNELRTAFNTKFEEKDKIIKEELLNKK